MGCLGFGGIQNGGEQAMLTLLMIVLLLGVIVINYFFWMIIRMSSCLFSPKLTLFKCCLYNMVACNLVSGCITLPNHIFLFTRDEWSLDTNVCQLATIMDSVAETTMISTVLLYALDRFASKKIPVHHNVFCKRQFLAQLPVISTWVAAIIFSLPEIVYNVQNENLASRPDCNSVDINHGICGFYREAGIPVYRFVILYLVPTAVSFLLLGVGTYLEKCVPSTTNPEDKPTNDNLENTSNNPDFTKDVESDKSDASGDDFEHDHNEHGHDRDGISENKHFNHSQLSSPSSSSFEVDDQAEFQKANIDLINHLPAADTRMSALPHIDSSFRLQQLRLLLESRASIPGDEEGRITPVEAWPDYSADPHSVAHHSSNSMYVRCQPSPLTLGNCNLSLSSPPPYPIPESTEMDSNGANYDLAISHKKLVTKQNVDRTGRYRSAISPAEFSEKDSRYCFSPPAMLGQAQGQIDGRQDLRGKQKHARLRKKWKVRKLEMLTLPPIKHQITSEQGQTTGTSCNMYDQTLPVFEKTTVKVITINVILYMAMWLPYHLVSLVMSTCSGCQMGVSSWIALKCLTYIPTVLSPLIFCFYHPVLNHTMKFVMKIFKAKTTNQSANKSTRKYPSSKETDS